MLFTYYIIAKSLKDYRLRYTFTAVLENGSASKKKATTIPKGKTATGLVLSEDSVKKVDWYKVRLSKSRKLSFDVKAKSCDTIKFEFIPASSRIILFGSTFSLYDSESNTYATKGAMPARTYYIKVYKYSKTTSGYYSIKFN
ncbi:hypothetical protein [Anaeromicropila herbilytica]|uniref:Uncharacterized protein n=1 Tax=Anaeromicropila herbilytica TaxID=2785025 RepID=A0A7R7EPY4_9FIRM|nr:hypothetical protein [Anaeromicropila herbilytica]BCN32342.1 hypothetical protein bsdtb5_36370 [Anaeromicropila herbilytica]